MNQSVKWSVGLYILWRLQIAIDFSVVAMDKNMLLGLANLKRVLNSQNSGSNPTTKLKKLKQAQAVLGSSVEVGLGYVVPWDRKSSKILRQLTVVVSRSWS